MSDQVVSATRVVPAPPEDIFALLRDPAQHANLDGSGTVKGSRGTGDLLGPGSTFSMDMRIGVPYRIKNTVVEYEQDRRIAWRHFGGHVWRWELEPVDGGTRVTESFDWGPSPIGFLYDLLGFPERNREGIEATLDGLVERFSTTPS